jgi:hypothetical protein
VFPEQIDIASTREYMYSEYPPEVAWQGMVEVEYYNLYGELPVGTLVVSEILWVRNHRVLAHHAVGKWDD